MSDILVRYGRVLREHRMEQKISQEDFAEKCGLHRTYISDVELGKRNVSLENIERIANALGISISDYFKGI